jgi:hypothetical protein
LSFKRAIVTFLAFDVCGRAAADEPADAPPSQDAQDNRFGEGSADGLAVDFVVESDRAQLSEIVQRVRDERLRTNIGNVATLDDAIAVLNPTERSTGTSIIRMRP